MVVSGVAAAAFAFALAAADGLSGVLAPVVDPTEYWANLSTLPKASDLLLLHSTEDFLVDRSVHMKGHPPGFVLLLKGLAAIRLGKPWVTAALSYMGIALMVVAVLLTVRTVVGPEAMRRCAPFLVLAPFAVWLGTSADAFYAGIASCSIACGVIGIRAERWVHRVALGAATGFLFGSTLFLTYGAATLCPLMGIVILSGVRRRYSALVEFALPALVFLTGVAAVFNYFGFWWFDGLRLTNKFYWVGSAYFRTWTYFLLANIAVLAVAVGPAVIVGIVWLRDRRVWLIVGGAIACITLAELSQYSKGEVERIWLLFMPWLVPATVSLAPSGPTGNDRAVRVWLCVQATLAIALQATLRSKW